MSTSSQALPSPAVRVRVQVTGVVQGVGFRPYVHALAVRHALTGVVRNDEAGVVVEVEGRDAAVEAFLAALPARVPPLATVDTVVVERLPPAGSTGFTIADSTATAARTAVVPPDAATCDACLAEVHDPADRRYRYPFANCTACGPRYTIVRDVPYDRARTTMAGFAMCADCRREYDDVADRRFHAEPVCCPACGPRLRLVDREGRELDGDPLETAAGLLCAGGVVAVKGLGGYHLAVDAGDEDAVAGLRARKHREHRPFAVMVADLAIARQLAEVDVDEQALLTGPARPVVLLHRRVDAPVAPAVAPGSLTLGLFLPYTPLHSLLLAAAGRPLVMTSGNLSDEPIAYRDDDAVRRLGALADALLVSDRPVQTRVDDSVVRVVAGRPLPLRRSRGYVPQPVRMLEPFPRHVLACGPELKATLCLGRGRSAFLSHHLGDLENYETLACYLEAVEHLQRLLDVQPQVVAHDLHPQYLSTQHALGMDGVALVGVQHHHAHVASCLADNGRAGPVIGVAFDGLGMGTDGALWGGEVLVADLVGFRRAAHLAPVPMPGGAAAVRQPWRMAAAHLAAAYPDPPVDLAVVRRQGRRWGAVLAAARAGVNAPPTTSAGRLFDAVAAIVGLRDEVTYEGQAAVELEHCADPAERSSYPVQVGADAPFVIDGAALVRAVVDDVRAGVPAPAVAAHFHEAVADVVSEVCTRVRADEGLSTVALSGGVFQNARLVAGCLRRLGAAGFEVLTHRQVPPNDGGLSLGQAAVAGARDRAGLV